jgi:hypothetical protein
MNKPVFCKMVSCALLFLFPTSMSAADSNAAMLYSNGGARVNGADVRHSSSVIFSGDLLQTQSDSAANINAPGSSIIVLPDSEVQFEGSSVRIAHGGIAVSTSRGVATTAGGVKVAPTSKSWTQFDVIDADGTVRIAARTGDVTVTDGKSTVTLAQGQETTRDESSAPSNKIEYKKKKKKSDGGAAESASGAILNTTTLAVGIGAAAVAGIVTWALLQSGNPVSPSKP